MSNQYSDSFVVAVELEEAGSAPSSEELALIEANFGDLIKLATNEQRERAAC